MIVFLRYLSLINAAVWCGASIFLIICMPGLFSAELTRVLTPAYVGLPAQAIMERYFYLNYCCAGISLLHLVSEWLYLGRPIQRFTLWLLLGITCFTLIGGFIFQPKIKDLHRAKWWGRTPPVRVEAARSLAIWHGVSEVTTWFVVSGVILYFFRIIKPNESSRFIGH